MMKRVRKAGWLAGVLVAVLCVACAPSVTTLPNDWELLATALRGDATVTHGTYARVFDTKGTVVDDARRILVLTALGGNAADVGGVDLVSQRLTLSRARAYGLMGSVWTLLAADSGAYACADRALLVDALTEQFDGKGWGLTDTDVDATAMALVALRPYTEQESVAACVDTAWDWIASVQNADATFSSYGVANCESTAQVLIALTCYGMDRAAHCVREGVTVADALAGFAADGGYAHVKGGPRNATATRQAELALLSHGQNRNPYCFSL